MDKSPVSLEKLLADFRAGHSLSVASIQRLANNGVNIGMTTAEQERARDLLSAASNSLLSLRPLV